MYTVPEHKFKPPTTDTCCAFPRLYLMCQFFIHMYVQHQIYLYHVHNLIGSTRLVNLLKKVTIIDNRITINHRKLHTKILSYSSCI